MRLTLNIAILMLVMLPALARAEEPGCARTYGRIAGAKAWSKVMRGKALVKLDSDSFNVFEKIRLNPEAELSVEELALIQSHKLEATLDAYRGTNGLVRKLNQIIAIQKRAQPMKKSHKVWPGFKTWTADKLRYLAYSSQGMLPQDFTKVERLILDYLGQGVLPANRLGGPTQYAAHIYAKALKEDFYGLSEFDRNFLKTWGYEKDYERFAADAKRYREGFLTATKIQDTADGLKWGVLGTAAGAAALAPYLADRVENPEELEKRVKEIKGGVQLMFSEDPAVPTLLRTKGSAVLFEMPEAKFLTGDKLAEFDRMLAEKKINYSRVVIQADPDEVRRVMAKAKEFVSRTKTNGQGQKVLDKRMHLDSGLAESYKILESELGFPPAPVAKRYSSVMSAYFGLMKATGNSMFHSVSAAEPANHDEKPKTQEQIEKENAIKERVHKEVLANGRIKDFFVARVNPDSPSRLQESSSQALSSYFDAMIYAFSPKLTGGGALAIDAMPNTLWKKEMPIKEKPKAPAETKPVLPSVPVSQ